MCSSDLVSWGKPMSAVLGAFKAQKNLEIAAIGGKDSMSGTFEDIDVPPTLISFAVTTDSVDKVISPEFKSADSKVLFITPEYTESGLPTGESLKMVYNIVNTLNETGAVKSAYTPGFGGIADAIFKMCMGNKIGFRFNDKLKINDIFDYAYGRILVEVDGNNVDIDAENIIKIGETTSDYILEWKDNAINIETLSKLYEQKLEPVYKCNIKTEEKPLEEFSYDCEKKLHASYTVEKPKVLIPVFPGTNCEYDSARAFDEAGAETDIFVINNLNSEEVAKSVDTFAARIRAH